jgi:hypothetical protein
VVAALNCQETRQHLPGNPATLTRKPGNTYQKNRQHLPENPVIAAKHHGNRHQKPRQHLPENPATLTRKPGISSKIKSTNNTNKCFY